MSLTLVNPVGTAYSLVASASGAVNAFERSVTITPVGMLHLERIEMEPAGIERGELVATIPLAPSEVTNVVQKEWAVTSQEFSSIVTDFLESYSEKGVTEKTELADSTESQTKHSEQLGLNASVSGSYGFVTFATSANFNTSSSDDESKKASRNHATEVTQKASTRVRKEHKVTIQTSSVVGKEDTSTRTLTNPSSTDTMRIDYFSMMRKWRVRLLQYGLRMTYDIAIPEPGATLRALHAQLASLEEQLSGSFAFSLDPTKIGITNDYLDRAKDLGIALEPQPDADWSHQFSQTLQKSKDASVTQTLDFDIKEGYAISKLTVGGWGSPSEDSLGFSLYLVVPPTGMRLFVPPSSGVKTTDIEPFSDFDHPGVMDLQVDAFDGNTGHISIPFMQDYMSSGVLYASVHAARLDATNVAWQQRVWQALYNAARDAYYTQQQLWTQQRDALKAEIENVDTLTLRREEREEIMKGVLRWLLGPEFDFMPQEVQALFLSTNRSVADWVNRMSEWFVNDDTGMTPANWSTMYMYGEMVKFIMEAIEWENLLYIVYPYFWDIPFAWDFVRRLQHPDPTREAFLRAGSTRVVLTVRPGWEDDFLGFLENGEFGNLNHPYMTISDEMRAYANTNYPGIPPANPESSVRPLLMPSQRKAWQDMQTVIGLLEQYKAKNSAYPTTAQGLAALAGFGNVPSADPWGNPYQYLSPGKYNDYDLFSYGADGAPGGDGENADITSWATASLIGEWFEYTPSHGLDIGITTAFANMQ
jgi:hypothetical protein